MEPTDPEIRLYARFQENILLYLNFHRNLGGYKQGENGELKRGRGHITGAQFLPRPHARRNLVHGTFPEIPGKQEYFQKP
jgi:hypothetical protein